MKTWKRSIRSLVILNLALVVSIFGCLATIGGKGNAAQAAEGDKGPIKIGFLGPLSQPGDYRAGQANLAVAKLWISDVNSRGGIDGRKVSLEIADSQGKPEVAVGQATRLITEKGVSAILGFWHSSAVLAASDVVRRFDVPMLVHYSWDDQITKRNYDQVFRVGPYSGMLASRTVPYLRKQGYGRVAVLSEDSATTLEASKAIKRLADGQPAVDVIAFQAQTIDLTPQLSKLASDPPDALLIESVYAASRLVFNQAAEVGLNVPIIAGWDYPTLPDFWEAVGKNGVGVVYPTFYHKDMGLTSQGSRFKDLFREATGADPAIYEFLLWDCLNAIKGAVERSKSSDPAKLVEALQKTQMEGTTGHISFTRKKGTVRYNQWNDVTMFFKKMTKVGQKDNDAELIMTIH